MSKIEVNKVGPQCGTTVTVGCGAGQTVTVDAATVNLGRSGGTVNLVCGATQSGFGRTGTVDWCTTAKTSPFTSVSGKGYFINTSGGAVTVTLPSSPSAGDIVAVNDYALSACSNAITIGRGGSKIDGLCSDMVLETKGIGSTLVYVDGTKGWKSVNSNEIFNSIKYVTATGGSVTTSGDYKIHTFTGDGCFAVSCAGSSAGSNKVSYLVVAGGGGGGGDGGGGGGAGGFREGKCTSDPYTASPLNAPDGLSVSVQTYPVAVGAGGNGNGNSPWNCVPSSISGNNSVFSSITSAKGGGAGRQNAAAGGSGGGGGRCSPGAGGAGNTPPVSPAQGFAGGDGDPGGAGSGGGGGATGVGGSASNANGAAGGPGATSSINGSAVTRGGGGGGGATPHPNTRGSGGAGGGGQGAGSGSGTACAGSANTGGGGGGGTGSSPPFNGSGGGSGVVIIRYKFQN